MKSLYIKLLYYLGHITYLLGLKYWYIPGAYYLYGYFMQKSSELDIENVVWSKPLPPPEKDDV